MNSVELLSWNYTATTIILNNDFRPLQLVFAPNSLLRYTCAEYVTVASSVFFHLSVLSAILIIHQILQVSINQTILNVRFGGILCPIFQIDNGTDTSRTCIYDIIFKKIQNVGRS
jgi:hypothetical protein